MKSTITQCPPVPAAGMAVAGYNVPATRLEALWADGPVLLVFLRHLGCIFARETLLTLAAAQAALVAAGLRPVVVHLGAPFEGGHHLAHYGVFTQAVADEDGDLYRAFGLRRGSPWQLLGPRAIVAAVRAWRHKARPGRRQADARMLSGAFLVRDGCLVAEQRARYAGDTGWLGDLLADPAREVPRLLGARA